MIANCPACPPAQTSAAQYQQVRYAPTHPGMSSPRVFTEGVKCRCTVCSHALEGTTTKVGGKGGNAKAAEKQAKSDKKN